MNKTNMKQKFVNFITYLDFFGINFNFKYKHHESFKNFIGGFISTIFLIILITHTLTSIFIFFNKEKMSINYYETDFPKTDSISFQNYSYGIGFLGSCNNNEKNELFSNLFSYNFSYVTITKNYNNIEKKRYPINFHLCTYSDFYYYSNETLDLMEVNGTYFCPDYLNYSMKGFYNDEEFNYYEITIYAKYTNEEFYQVYYNLLINNDCKFHIFFPIISQNMYNYSYPFEYHLFDLFFSLNPIMYSKRNIFFKLQKFKNYHNYFFDIYDTKYYLDYSLYDDYYLYKSNERFTNKYNDYDKFASIYLRADTKIINISREYQKISILISGITSFFYSIYLLLKFILFYFKRFYAYNSVIRKIFKFHCIRDTDTFDLVNDLQKKLKINQILQYQKMNCNIPSFYKFDQTKRKTSLLETKSDSNIHRSLFQNKNKDEKKENQNEKNESLLLFMKSENIEKKSSKTNINLKSNFFDLQNSFNFKFNPAVIKKFERRLDFSLKYNLYELFTYMFCKDLTKGNLSKKHKYMDKAIENLLNNLDIHVYFNKMQMIELFNFILFEPYQNTILKFLSKPYLSITSYKFNLIDFLPKMFKTEFTKQELTDFTHGYKKLLKTRKKNIIEEKLCNMVNLEIGNLFG